MKTRVKIITGSKLPERDINEALCNIESTNAAVNIKDIRLDQIGVLDFTILIIYEIPTES